MSPVAVTMTDKSDRYNIWKDGRLVFKEVPGEDVQKKKEAAEKMKLEPRPLKAGTEGKKSPKPKRGKSEVSKGKKATKG